MNNEKINIQLDSKDLTRLMIGLEQQINKMENDEFNPALEDNKRLLKKLMEIKRNYITNYLY